MIKSLVREVPFGKATAKITVAMFTEIGVFLNENVLTNSTVEIVLNGKVVDKGYFANILEFNNITDTLYEKASLDVTKKYTRIGHKAITEGDESGVAINAAIEEMKNELSKEFGIETEESKQQRVKIEEAEAIVKMAEKEGIENLMSQNEIQDWKNRYNLVMNEGGEGYIPTKISKESYQHALSVLKRRG